MRILMLSWEYPPRIVGGISRVVHGLANKLGEKGNEVHVVTCWDNNLQEIQNDGNVYVHRVRKYDTGTNNLIEWVMQLNFSMIEQSIKIISDYGAPDIIHGHDWMVQYASRVIKHAYSIPLVSTIHATEHGRNQGIHNELQRYISTIEWWLTYESWRVIVNSEYMSGEVKRLFQLPGDKVRIIPNGVDINKFNGIERDNDFRRRFALDSEKMILFVGRLVNEKGAQVLLEAAPKVLSRYSGAKFVAVGKGPQFDYLRGRSMEMNISDKFYLTGYLSDEDLCRLYKCADIAVFPSLYEPFGIVALEGMTANVPVVVSDAGGLNEIVCHGFDGMKSYAGNANSLADSILEILFDSAKAENIRNNAFDKVKKYYNWDRITEKTIEVYREVIGENGG